MNSKPYRRFYFLSIAVLLTLSSYPLFNGVRMAVLSLQNDVIEPEQYAKYVVPYAAICAVIILFALFQPLLFKLKRFAFPAGLTAACGVFFAAEYFMEKIKVNTAGMTLIDPSTLAPGSVTVAPGSVDIWQAALCIASPDVREQSVAFAARDSFYYVMESSAYKIHYYLISLILITMVCGLVYGIGKLFRSGGQEKPLILRGISTAVLIALCVFANTTAFFRQTAAIQTSLASVLTCMFFVMLGAAVGIYAGSYLLGKRKLVSAGLPVLISMLAAIVMYVGEAVMMNGNLYRFGTSWFFSGLPGIALAPADILVVMLSAGLTWLILGLSEKHDGWPGRRTAIFAVLLSAAVAGSGVAFSVVTLKSTPDDELFGCYEFDECLYMNPLSSFYAYKASIPYVYGLSVDAFIEANTVSGDIMRYSVRYEKTPVSIDDFPPKTDLLPDSRFSRPDPTQYKTRYLIATLSGEYRLYQMDGELWLVRGGSGEKATLWSIYRLKKTTATTLADLERAVSLRESQPPPVPSPGINDRLMTLKDVYALARKAETLELRDFEPFDYKLTGPDFTIRRYDVEGATITLLIEGKVLESARLMSWRTLDESKSIDLREGFEAVAAYMNPLNSLDEFTIEDTVHDSEDIRELIYEYDYDRCRYYINTKRADTIFVVFENGERMPLKQALEERRITIEDTVAHGLYNVSMVPIDNPLGGEFTVLHHLYTFELDGEAFYPSKSFMYVVWDDSFATYFDVEELADFLDWYGKEDKAEKLRNIADTRNLPIFARGTYIRDTDLLDIGLEISIGWAYSSHTPVHFTTAR